MEPLTKENNQNKIEQESVPSKETEQDPSTKPYSREELEERCYKLKGFAVKLKQKVNDLSKELKTSETEKAQLILEKEEIQKKISQVSNNVKKLQTIQLEYDKLQDDLDKQKSENKKVTKNLESLIIDNTSLKESNFELKETVANLNADLENYRKEITKLKNILKKNSSFIKELEDEQKAKTVICNQREKDYEEMKVKLEAEIQSHKITQSRLDIAKQECSSNNVMLLEVDNYEKSIKDLKLKLSDVLTKSSTLEKTIEENRQTISSLEFQLSEMRDSLFLKTNQLTTLGEKNEALKAELNDFRQEISQMTQEKQGLLKVNEAMKANMDKLSKESTTYAAEKNKLTDNIDLQNKIHLQQIEQLKIEISRLNIIILNSNEELTALKSEYDGYKLRAQSVLLKTKQSQNKECGLSGKNMVEIEAELNHFRSHSAQLQEKLDISCHEIKILTNELALIKEQRDITLENTKDLGNKLTALNQDYLSLKDKYRAQLTTIDQLKIQLESTQQTLKENYSDQLASMEVKYQQEIENLQTEIQKLANIKNVKNLTEKLVDTKLDNDSGLQARGDIYLLTEREDGEGSESVDSYSANPNMEKNQKSSLMPLDELLNSAEDFSKFNIPVLPAKIDRHELEIAERRIKHLTTLLADAERDVAKLNQMNQLLKEDIRRQQRSVEREHLANNFEYLKNVIIKFITLKNGDERSRLIPVLNTILKLSPEETQQINQVAGITGGRGWLPSISIPGWSHE